MYESGNSFFLFVSFFKEKTIFIIPLFESISSPYPSKRVKNFYDFYFLVYTVT